MTYELGPQLTRDEVLDRARTWLLAAVPYSQTAFHSNEHGRYRTDCSGYVSMAWPRTGRENRWQKRLR